MSGTITPTTPAPPTAIQAATQMLQTIGALNGSVTDYNSGSNVRVQAQAFGNIAEQQGISALALALQAIVYGAMGLFGIYPSSGTSATGVVTFATSFPVSAAPTATQAIPIPAGTIVQTPGGILFSTLLAAVLASGTASVNVGAQANAIGTAGNVPALAIGGTPLTSVGWPLFVQNSAPMEGGANAGTPSQALALFASTVAKLGRVSPIAVANAPVGVTVSGTGETVEYAWTYEPWIAAGTGAGSGTAGYTVFIDDGTGGASSNLIAAVTAYLTGNTALNQDGYRPIGVPFTVSAAVPVYAVVGVTGVVYPGIVAPATVQASVVANVEAYFASLGSALLDPAEQPQIAAEAANAGQGLFQSLAVSLFYSGSPTAVPSVTGSYMNRVILNGLSVSVTNG